MSKKTKRSLFKEMRWVYGAFAVLAIIISVLILAVPSIMETIEKAVPNLSEALGDVDVKTYLLVSLGVSAVLDLWFAYLICRCADGESKGTLLLVLLILSVTSGVVQMISTKSYYDIGLIIDAVTLFDKNENN